MKTHFGAKFFIVLIVSAFALFAVFNCGDKNWIKPKVVKIFHKTTRQLQRGDFQRSSESMAKVLTSKSKSYVVATASSHEFYVGGHIYSPPVCPYSGESIKLLIIVFSTPTNQEARQAM